MSTRSSPATDVIAFPQGGGALHGLGETFSPSLPTGNGNSPSASGWSPSIPGVSRKTAQGVPRSPYDLLPAEVTDPASMTTRVEYDYRAPHAGKVADPKGNWRWFGFTPLGQRGWSASIDKHGRGDTEDRRGTRLAHDFLAFAYSSPDGRQPVSVRTICRIHHANEEDVPPGEADDTAETKEYSDGFGRLLQERSQAEELTCGDPACGDAGCLPIEPRPRAPRAPRAPGPTSPGRDARPASHRTSWSAAGSPTTTRGGRSRRVSRSSPRVGMTCRARRLLDFGSRALLRLARGPPGALTRAAESSAP
jgi:hypothetical protein